ncbi:MAG: lipid-A-disaccharide synthase [Gammaproteobacteria bacterium]
MLVAGEASGDLLGGALIEALRRHYPGARYSGVGGERMTEAGLDAWWDRRELSVMGLFEVLSHLPRLLRLRRALRARILAAAPDAVIGIDAPDFNLGLERSLKAAGLRTVHYVSPTVWAWRTGRAAKIGRAVDLLLCLFPFEPEFYDGHGVRARYTGHPLADAIPLESDRAVARERLGLERDGTCVALLPGSRRSEVERLTTPLLDAAERLAGRRAGLTFLAALADENTAAPFRAELERRPELACRVFTGRALEVMEASDAVALASGTATLECMLVNRPMAVIYRLSPMTYHAARMLKMFKSEHFALPNILAGERLVPELLQEDVNGEAIADALEAWLNDPGAVERLSGRFRALHRELRCDAAASAADAIRELLDETQGAA